MSPLEQAILYIFMGVTGFLLPLSPLSADRSYRMASLLNAFVSAPGQFLIIYLLQGLVVDDVTIMLFAFVYAVATVILVFVLTRNLQNLPLRGSVVLNSVFMNSINLPLPLLQILTGSFTYAASYSVASNLTQIISSKILQGVLGTGNKSSGKYAWQGIVRASPLFMVVVGSFLHYTIWTNVQTSSLSNLLGTVLTIFLSLNFLYFGSSLQKSIQTRGAEGTRLTRPLLVVGIFRTLIGPLITITLALTFFLDNSSAFIELVFVGTMPPAITNTVLSGIYGFDESFSARSTLLLTPLNIAEALSVFYLVKLLRF